MESGIKKENFVDNSLIQIQNFFTFLKEFNKLKTRRRCLNLDSFEKILWFSEIPKEKECYSILEDLNTENCQKTSHFNKWIEIKKPKRKPRPEPPEKIRSWLREDTNNTPELHSYIISEQNKRIYLKDHPEIKQIFENYFKKEWTPWSKEEDRVLPVVKVYDDLYNLYKKNKDKGEVYQIVLGLGLLSSKNKKGLEIKRHIVEAPCSIKFNSKTGTITVAPCEQIAELSLVMDMFIESEKPENTKDVSVQLSELSNDFWKNEKFINCLKSWINTYDSKGQFLDWSEINSPRDFSTLSVSPAIILRKRTQRAFIEFYDEIIEKNKENEENLNSTRPSLMNMIKKKMDFENVIGLQKDSSKGYSIAEKHYFPLPVNKEQEEVIKKSQTNNLVVVQGPPGTGKTHSIANLICHFLATGKRILITSQTERALKVLREKLPEEIKKLCVEILGKDQGALQELKNSCSAIHSRHGSWDDEESLKTIHKLEEKDNDLKGKIAKVKNELYNIKNFESQKYENLFGFYKGSPALIATRIKNEEEKYGWIAEFNFDQNQDCPVSNSEAISFFSSIKKLKDINDALLKEEIKFEKYIFTLKELEDKIKREKEMKQIVEKKCYEKEMSSYRDLPDKALDQLKLYLEKTNSKATNLLNRDEKWVKRALGDCLSDKDRQWRYLYTSTQDILDKNKNVFSEADELTEIKIDPRIPPFYPYLSDLLKRFFDKYKSDDQIKWKFSVFCKIIRDITKIKINGKNISSYNEVKQFENYLKAKQSLEKIYHDWKNQAVNTINPQARSFMKNYHVFKDFLEPLDDCLSIHKITEDIKKILDRCNIPQFQWTVDSVKKELKIIECVQAQRGLKKIETDFEKIISDLSVYKDQKNQIAQQIISSYKKRDLQKYKEVLKQVSELQENQKKFSRICKTNNKLNNKSFYLKLKQEIDNPLWENNLKFFEEAWVWKKADGWLKEQTNEEFYKELKQKRDDLLKKQKRNMEELTSEKAWRFCLSQLKDEELKALKAWKKAISKIGKGTGVAAPKNRKKAKIEMEKCKTAIPAWIMPLYRVVENIKPNTEPFDIAIIDEASQTGPDGFLLNYLARKIIVVGDEEQISPENPGIKDEDVEILKKSYLTGIEKKEYIGREYSYYDYCEIVSSTRSHVQLREHFRCMPEIIQFSNNISYSGTPLIPLRQYGSSRLDPLKTTYVDEAVSKIGNSRDPQNEKEVNAIVDQIEKCINDPSYDGKTFGIIVLQGKTQISVIEKALNEKIDKKEIEERCIRVGNAYDFQGDERDVIFLSMVVSGDWNITSLTRETYKKQYNVVASRAKDQMWLFHSVDLNDLSNMEDFRRKLLSHCKNYTKKMTVWPDDKLNELYKKIRETKNKHPDNAPEPFESWFEARVFYKIAMKGYHVIPQYEVSNYRIDMIIVGSKSRLAVECDGDYWHSGEQKESQDLERQWNLEKSGWTFWRVKNSVFNRDEEGALKSLWDLLNDMEIHPLGKTEDKAV